MRKETGARHLLLTWLLAWNLAAIDGSIAIIVSFLSAIAALRSSICSETHSRNGWPITAAQTLTINYFGVFGMSGASGR